MINSVRSLLLSRNLQCVACYLIALGIAVYSWAPLRNIQWGIIDDHEIMFFIGTNERLPIDRIIPTLMKTEISPDSNQARFRPSYYGVRLLESALFGKNVTLWYIARSLVAIILSLTIVRICLLVASPLITLGFIFFSLTPVYWSDIFAKAGPAEVYGVLGFCIIALVLAHSYSNRFFGAVPSIFTALGVALAVGSKENLILAALAPICIIFWSHFRLTRFAFAVQITSLIFVAYVVFSLYMRLTGVEVDIYENKIDFFYRLYLLKGLFYNKLFVFWFFLVCLACFVCFMASRIKLFSIDKFENFPSAQKSIFFVELLLFVAYVSQFFFYSGNWPDRTSGRYLFPGVLANDFGILIAATCISNFSRVILVRPHWGGLLNFVIFLFLFFPAVVHIGNNRNESINAVAATSKYQMDLSRLLAMLKDDSSTPLIINSHSVWDYEPIYSLERYVRSGGYVNPIAVNIQGYSSFSFSPGSLERKLAVELTDIVNNGLDSKFIPLSSASPFNCVSVGMHGSPLSSCQLNSGVIFD